MGTRLGRWLDTAANHSGNVLFAAYAIVGVGGLLAGVVYVIATSV